MLRKALAVAIAVVAFTFSGSAISAKAPGVLGSVSGRAIDAGGGAVGAQRIELLQGGRVVSVATTTAFGEWLFADVWPGEYIVRISAGKQVTGVRVSVGAGQAVAGTLIVVPTSMVSPQLGTLASLFTLVPAATTAVTATAVAQTLDTETSQINDVIFETILQQLPPAQRQEFAQQMITAIAQNPTSPYNQYVEELAIVVATNGNVVPNFPPAVPVNAS